MGELDACSGVRAAQRIARRHTLKVPGHAGPSGRTPLDPLTRSASPRTTPTSAAVPPSPNLPTNCGARPVTNGASQPMSPLNRAVPLPRQAREEAG